MKKFLLFVSLAFYINTNAQITFQKKFGGCNFYNVQQTKNSGYVIGGTIAGLPYLIKTNILGDTLWSKKYKVIGGATSLSNINLAKGGYVLTGAVDSVGAGNSDIFLLKTDTMGNVLWSKIYGGIDNDYGYAVQQTTDGGYIVAGNTRNFSAGNYDIYVIKTDSLGTMQWTKTYGTTANENITSIQQTKNGGYIISGVNNTVFLIKTNNIGDAIWTKNYTASSNSFGRLNLGGGFCQQTAGGGYIVSGSLNTNQGSFVSDAFYLKTDTSGNVLWSKDIRTNWGTCSTSYSSCNIVHQSNDKGYVFIWSGSAGCDSAGSSYYSGGSYLNKTDSMGNSIWTNSFALSNPPPNITAYTNLIQTADSGYALVAINNAAGASYFIKTNKMGATACADTTNITNITTANIVSSDTSFTMSLGGVSANANIQITNVVCTYTTICSSVASINQLTNNNTINIYPNPAQNNFTIETSTNEKQMIFVFDVNGKLVLNQFIQNKTTIDASSLNAGVYSVNITNNEGTQTKKLVIVK